jgi:hypothetical protein
MKNNFTIFYSWQSDIPKNRNVIKGCIEKAIKEVKKEMGKNVNLEINIDRDTKDKTGSPEISDTILQKIAASDIFICDVTLVNNSQINRVLKQRLTSNPNVLFELGYAIKQLGWGRTICINNLDYGRTEQLPFDIRNHRVTTFNSNKTDYKKDLVKVLTDAIGVIIENYDKLEDEFNDGKLITHDIGIYDRIDKILPEYLLNDSINSAVNSLFSNRYYYNAWDSVIEFYQVTENRILDEGIHERLTELLRLLDDFRMLCATKFTVENLDGETIREIRMSGREVSEEEKFEAMQNERFFTHKEPFPTETWPQADERILKLEQTLLQKGQDIIKAYKEYVIAFKKYTLIG